MSSSREKYYRVVFLAAALYDTILGIVFMFFHGSAYQLLDIYERLPYYRAYLSLIGAFLFVIGIAYWLIYFSDLRRNRDLITVGALYKLAYCATAVYYFILGEYPHALFVWLFGLADLVFFILMVECRLFLARKSTT